MPVQSPPNLSAEPATLRRLLACGVEDWGGVSPGVTPDHVNPEAAWPEIAALRRQTEAAGRLGLGLGLGLGLANPNPNPNLTLAPTLALTLTCGRARARPRAARSARAAPSTRA